MSYEQQTREFLAFFEIEERGRGDRTVVATLSTTTPVETFRGLQILDHTPSAIDLSRFPLPIVRNHQATSMQAIGRAKNPRIVGDGLKVDLSFGKSQKALETWQDIEDGTARHLSVGFLVIKETKPDHKGVYHVTRWQPMEASIVPVPADVNAVIGRSATKEQFRKFFNNGRAERNMKQSSLKKADRFFAEGFEYNNYTDFFNALAYSRSYKEDDPKMDKRASGLDTTDWPEIPGDLTAKLLQPQNVSPLWTMATKIPIGGGFGSIQIPTWEESTRSGSVLGGVSFTWAPETGSTDYVMPQFRQLNLNLWKCMGVIAHTSELREDGLAFETVIGNTLHSGLNSLVEEMLIRGTGSGQPLGIMNASCTIKQDPEGGQNPATILSENVMGMISHQPPESMYRAIWLAHPETQKQLSGLYVAVGSGGGMTPLFRFRQGGEKYHKLAGLDVLFSEHCSPLGTQGDLILADLSQMIVTFKPVREQMSIHVLFSTAEELYKVVMRWNAQPAWSKAITPAQGSTEISPFVVLADRG